MSEEKKERKVKALAPFVVGNWSSNRDVFTALPKQPEADITDLAGIVAWTKANYGEEAGTYEFVRMQPGKLTIAVQTTMKAVLG